MYRDDRPVPRNRVSFLREPFQRQSDNGASGIMFPLSVQVWRSFDNVVSYLQSTKVKQIESTFTQLIAADVTVRDQMLPY